MAAAVRAKLRIIQRWCRTASPRKMNRTASVAATIQAAPSPRNPAEAIQPVCEWGAIQLTAIQLTSTKGLPNAKIAALRWFGARPLVTNERETPA